MMTSLPLSVKGTYLEKDQCFGLKTAHANSTHKSVTQRAY